MPTPPKPPAEPVVVSQRTIHQGRKFDFVSLGVRRPGGGEQHREIVRHPGAVVVVPITDDRRVVLIRNFRISVEQWLVECCAGTIERARQPELSPHASYAPFGSPEAEDPAHCAARELIEETGYRAASLHPLGWYYTTPGLTDEQMFAFAATGLTHVGQDLEDDESISVELVPAPEALAMALDGGIRDAKSMLALLLSQRAGLI